MIGNLRYQQAVKGLAMTMTTRAALIWSALLGLMAILGSYALACVFPFAAIAALAALTLDRRAGVALVAATWAANQVVGFTLMSYPHDAQAYAWGGAILVAALGGFAAARSFVRGPFVAWRSLGVLAAAIMAYQAVMFAAAVALDGLASSTPAIVAQIALADVAWFAGLSAAYLALTRALARPVAITA